MGVARLRLGVAPLGQGIAGLFLRAARFRMPRFGRWKAAAPVTEPQEGFRRGLPGLREPFRGLLEPSHWSPGADVEGAAARLTPTTKTCTMDP